jgi:hypothetical protein
MARPSPAPPASRARASSRRVNRSKTRSRSAVGMPGSSSLTVTTTQEPAPVASDRVAACRVAWVRVWRTALSSRRVRRRAPGLPEPPARRERPMGQRATAHQQPGKRPHHRRRSNSRRRRTGRPALRGGPGSGRQDFEVTHTPHGGDRTSCGNRTSCGGDRTSCGGEPRPGQVGRRAAVAGIDLAVPTGAPTLAPRDVLILDEPTNGLDLRGTGEVPSPGHHPGHQPGHRPGFLDLDVTRLSRPFIGGPAHRLTVGMRRRRARP